MMQVLVLCVFAGERDGGIMYVQVLFQVHLERVIVFCVLHED